MKTIKPKSVAAFLASHRPPETNSVRAKVGRGKISSTEFREILCTVLREIVTSWPDDSGFGLMFDDDTAVWGLHGDASWYIEVGEIGYLSPARWATAGRLGWVPDEDDDVDRAGQEFDWRDVGLPEIAEAVTKGLRVLTITDLRGCELYIFGPKKVEPAASSQQKRSPAPTPDGEQPVELGLFKTDLELF